VLLPVPDDPTISFVVWFKAGSQNDPAGKEGLASLVGSLLAEGATTKNSYEAILAKLYPLASSYEVRVDREMTTVSGRTHKDNLERFYELFTDAVLRPAFEPADFERLRSNALNELRNSLRYASDEELGKAAFHHFVFQGTPYAHPLLGTAAGLQALTVDDAREFYARWYGRGNAVIALGGGYPADLPGRLQRDLEALPAGAPAAAAVQPAPFQGRQLLLVDKPGADASISFGYPIDVRRGSREYYALWVANSWLGEHRNSSSHLYQVIRSARGLNYGDYSYIEAYPEGGQRQKPPTNVARRQQCFEIWIRTLPNDQAAFALRAALRELQDLAAHGPGGVRAHEVVPEQVHPALRRNDAAAPGVRRGRPLLRHPGQPPGDLPAPARRAHARGGERRRRQAPAGGESEDRHRHRPGGDAAGAALVRRADPDRVQVAASSGHLGGRPGDRRFPAAAGGARGAGGAGGPDVREMKRWVQKTVSMKPFSFSSMGPSDMSSSTPRRAKYSTASAPAWVQQITLQSRSSCATPASALRLLVCSRQWLSRFST
jgi:hypothetical protein